MSDLASRKITKRRIRVNAPIYLAMAALTIMSATSWGQNSTDPGNDEQPKLASQVPSTFSPEQLTDLINMAAADDLFGVHMLFSEPVTVEQVELAAQQLAIHRVVIYTSFPTTQSATRTMFIGVGEIYAHTAAREFAFCRARMYARSEQHGLDPAYQTPPEHWPVTKIHVYGSANVIRELQAGTILPAAIISDGHPQANDSVRGYQQAAEMEVSLGIQVPDNATIPAGCEAYTRRIDAPTLVGEQFPRQANSEQDTLSRVFQQLAERSLDTPVSLKTVFHTNVTLKKLASLVEEFEVDGLAAELTPSSGDRVIIEAALSIHGATINQQRSRIQCQMALARDRHITQSQGNLVWTTRTATVSVPVFKALRLLTHQNIRDAELLSDFRVGELERLVDYHQKKASEVVHMPNSIAIPEGCNGFMGH